MVSTLRSGGLYQREELGFGPFVGAPEILNGRSSVIATDADDPLNYVFAFFGGEFDVYDDQNFVARRMRDVPDRDVMNIIITCYGEAMAARGSLATASAALLTALKLLMTGLSSQRSTKPTRSTA